MTEKTIVIDNGSLLSKVGFAGQDLPCCIFPTVTGNISSQSRGVPESLAGIDAHKRCDPMTLCYPLERGDISNWDSLETLWIYMFYKLLKVNVSEHHLLLTEPPLNSDYHREKICQLLFETFEPAGVCLANHGVLSLFSTGHTSGLVLDSGEGATYTVPVREGRCVTPGVSRASPAGKDITHFLMRALRMSTFSQRDTVRNIKEKLCYVMYDPEQEIWTEGERKYRLPDGTTLTLGKECNLAVEGMFKPDVIDKNLEGVHESAFKSILACPLELHKTMYNNMVLAGGNTLFRGFRERFHKEMKKYAGKMSVTTHVPDDICLPHPAWTGGSALASLSTFTNILVTNSEYKEYGANIIHQKFS